jgi:hypothetical protein
VSPVSQVKTLLTITALVAVLLAFLHDGVFADSNYVWTGGAACPSEKGLTLFTDCTRLILHDLYHDYTTMCTLTGIRNGCVVASRSTVKHVKLLGFIDYTPGHGRTVPNLIAHIRVMGSRGDLYVYTDALVPVP